MSRSWTRWIWTLAAVFSLTAPVSLYAQEGSNADVEPPVLTDTAPEPEPASAPQFESVDLEPTPAEAGPIEAEPAPVRATPAPAPRLPEPARISDEEAPETDSLPRPTIEGRAIQDDAEPEREIIRERYGNANVKIEREVTQDAQGNFVNHGYWKWWDENGKLYGEGTYHYGQRHGNWSRWYQREESPVFTQTPFSQFTGPFLSTATFQYGRPHGAWVIYDSKQRKVCEINFADGERHGKAVWLYPSGAKLREIDFRNGEVHGVVQDWGTDGRELTNDEYKDGRKLWTKVSTFTNKAKQAEVQYLSPKVVLKDHDDWWNAKFATYTSQGKETKLGPWRGWHANGQKRVEGNFLNDVPNGHYVWWFANGQKQMEGTYAEGKQHGTWTWWHENGFRSITGDYANGIPSGKWTWWKDDGRVSQKLDMSHEQTVDKSKLPSVNEAALPQPELTRPVLR